MAGPSFLQFLNKLFQIQISTGDTKRKYHRIVDLSPEADVETATSTYKNGILEIVFKKREESKPKGKEIK